MGWVAKGEWGQGGGRRASEDWSWVKAERVGGRVGLWSGEPQWAMEIAIQGPAGAAGGSCDAARGTE